MSSVAAALFTWDASVARDARCASSSLRQPGARC